MITQKKKFVPSQAQQTPRPKPQPSSESDDLSLADRINAIAKSISSNATDVAPGLYEAIVSEAIWQEPDGKGQSVRIVFELCDSEFKDQNRIAQWFRILDIDKEPQPGAIKSLAFNMAKLGYQFDFNSLEEDLAAITKDRPGIIAKVTNNEWQGRMFVNVSVDKTSDNDVIMEYKDNVVY